MFGNSQGRCLVIFGTVSTILGYVGGIWGIYCRILGICLRDSGKTKQSRDASKKYREEHNFLKHGKHDLSCSQSYQVLNSSNTYLLVTADSQARSQLSRCHIGSWHCDVFLVFWLFSPTYRGAEAGDVTSDRDIVAHGVTSRSGL